MIRFILFFFLFAQYSFAQDMIYTKQVIDTLSSPYMFGRGYLKSGDRKAAIYIANEFKKIGLTGFNDSCFQSLSYPVNTMPVVPEVYANGKKLEFYKDFIAAAKSVSCKGKFKVVYFNLDVYCNQQKFVDFNKTDFSDKFILVDYDKVKGKDTLAVFDAIRGNLKKAKGIITIDDKLTFSVSTKKPDYVALVFKRSVLNKKIKKVKIDITTKFIEDYSTQNVVAYWKNPANPDTFILYTAHYDHLGGIGDKIYIPGANDNACGVSMLFNLAKYFKESKAISTKYSAMFVAFTGEEAGLRGSGHFVEDSPVPLYAIKLVLNFDVMGTGDDGITLVNGAVIKDLFAKFDSINTAKKYFPVIKARGESANSDHHPFWEKKIKSFFIYSMGGKTEYHNIGDRPETLTLTRYKELYNLIIDFISTPLIK